MFPDRERVRQLGNLIERYISEAVAMISSITLPGSQITVSNKCRHFKAWNLNTVVFYIQHSIHVYNPKALLCTYLSLFFSVYCCQLFLTKNPICRSAAFSGSFAILCTSTYQKLRFISMSSYMLYARWNNSSSSGLENSLVVFYRTKIFAKRHHLQVRPVRFVHGKLSRFGET